MRFNFKMAIIYFAILSTPFSYTTNSEQISKKTHTPGLFESISNNFRYHCSRPDDYIIGTIENGSFPSLFTGTDEKIDKDHKIDRALDTILKRQKQDKCSNPSQCKSEFKKINYIISACSKGNVILNYELINKCIVLAENREKESKTLRNQLVIMLKKNKKNITAIVKQAKIKKETTDNKRPSNNQNEIVDQIISSSNNNPEPDDYKNQSNIESSDDESSDEEDITIINNNKNTSKKNNNDKDLP